MESDPYESEKPDPGSYFKFLLRISRSGFLLYILAKDFQIRIIIEYLCLVFPDPDSYCISLLKIFRSEFSLYIFAKDYQFRILIVYLS